MKLTSRAARGIVVTVAACAAVMAPAIAIASTGSPARSAAPAFPSCETPHLVIWLDTNGSGAAGSTFYHLNFTNLGPTCTLNGFPFLFAINLTGHQIGKRASFSGPPPTLQERAGPPDPGHAGYTRCGRRGPLRFGVAVAARCDRRGPLRFGVAVPVRCARRGPLRFGATVPVC